VTVDKYEVLRRPVVTEKSDMLAETRNQYVFEVARRANKVQVRHAVEDIFGVRVTDVRTALMPGKTRRWGRHVSRTPAWKKAIVTLAPGDRIDLFE
jgi:large subunit ribosomal protein L23